MENASFEETIRIFAIVEKKEWSHTNWEPRNFKKTRRVGLDTSIVDFR